MSIGHNSSRKDAQKQIEQDTEAFLKNGGRITQLEAFVRTQDPTKGFNNRLLQGESDDPLQPVSETDQT